MTGRGRVVNRGARAALLLVSIVAAYGLAGAEARRPDPPPPLSIRITSPLGRTGAAGVVRIVAQVHGATPGAPVRFFVDNVMLGEVRDGPPYAVEWADENPFAPREITAEVVDPLGTTARDVVFLKPFEITETAEVSSVVLETAVQDRFGRFVTGIGPSGFTVLEDGLPQSLDVVRPETLPATYVLLIDSSQSMNRRMDFVRDAAASLAGYLRFSDRIVVAPFSKTIGTITGPTDDRQTVSDAIARIGSQGGTAIADSLVAAAGLMNGMEGRHALVLITDGYDEHSTRSFEEAIVAVQKSGTAVYVVGIGGVAGISIKGERMLKALATATGGRAFFPAREIELRPIHELVAADVQRRYLISYTPSNQKVDGTYRRITVTASDPTWVVRTRPGYFAPKPPPVRPSIEFTMVDTAKQLLDVSADDLQVFEDGAEQAVEVFQEAVTPISIVFALDESGSMKKAADTMKSAARSFVESLRPQDPLATMLFADKAFFAHDLSTNRSWALEAIDQYQANGGTALNDAVFNALMRLKGIEGRRVVVVMTDGRDENNPGTGPGSAHTFDDVIERLKSVEATVFPIGLGTRIDRDVLERLARESGGEAAFPEDVSLLGQEFRRIVENLRKRYVLGYTSTNSARDGKWRKVEIRSRRKGMVAVSRGGYFAPAR
jgi:Ca-activated chloride channel family protein